VRIIGVVRSPYSLEASERYAPSPAVFVVQGRINPFGELLIRTRTSDPRALVSLQARLHQLPEVAVGALRPWDEARARDLSSRGFLAAMFVAMGAVALALAALGLYGVLAYAVSRRRREFGIRLALGAEPVQLLRMVMHDGSVMILAGMGAGAFLALGAGRLLDALLVTVLPSDVWALVLSEALLLGVGVLAVLAPALRAMRADPIEILRAT
jgi:putative ABC transport system permease protein